MRNENKIAKFEKLIDSIGANKDDGLKAVLMLQAKKYDNFIDEATKLIEENNINLTCLFEDNENGDIAYDKYLILVDKIEEFD